MPNYVKIPKEIIYDTSLTDKRVIIFSYLCARRSLDDSVAFSITELCHWSKLKPNYRDGKINQKYYKTLLLLSHMNYFTEYPDFESLISEHKNSIEYLKVELNIEKFDIPDKFAIIYFDELEAILNYKEELQYSDIDLSRMSSAYILLVLAYIRLNMNRSIDKPFCCYRQYKTISDEIGIKNIYTDRKDEFKYLKENKDGSICVKFPLKWVKINPGAIPDPNKPKRVMSEEQKEKMRQALKKYRESQKK